MNHKVSKLDLKRQRNVGVALCHRGTKEKDGVKNDYDFTVMYRNEEVAFVHVSAEHKEVSIRKLIPDGMKQPFNGNKLDLERVYSFLKERCFEDGYSDLKRVLEVYDMESNNPWEWNRKTHGVTWEDYFWVKFKGEDITWEDVKWRD